MKFPKINMKIEGKWKEKCLLLVASGTARHAPEKARKNFISFFASNKNLD